MELKYVNGEECVLITRRQAEKMVLFHVDNELRAKRYFQNELLKPIETQHQQLINMYAGQELKARGFKEAWEEILYQFTGKICNVDDKGELIK